MRLLVTGSSGRLGRALCAHLAGEHEVVGVDRLPSPATRFVGDLGDVGLVRRALQGVEAVLHLAALHAPHVGQRSDDEFQRVNVEGTLALADAAAASGVGRFVFASTTALYGAGATGSLAAEWVDEATPPHPRTVYHRSKLAAETALAERAERHGLSLTVLRVARCFPEPAPQMAMYRLHRGVDARDVAQAHETALAWQAPGQARLFVISGATPFVRADAPGLATDAAAVLRRRVPGLVTAFAQRGWVLPPTIDRVYDSSAAQAALGWRPRFGFASVLAQAGAGDPAVLSVDGARPAAAPMPEPCT